MTTNCINKIRLTLIGFTFLLIGNSCMNAKDYDINVSDMTIENIVVPTNFNYSTIKEVKVSLTVPVQLKNGVFSLITFQNNEEGQEFGKGVFDDNGSFNAVFSIPAYIDTILVRSNYVGLIDGITIPVTGKTFSFDYRPLYADTATKAGSDIGTSLKSAMAGPYQYLGTYSSLGVPNYLVASDVIQQNLLDDVNASLPEYSRVPDVNPDFIASGTETNIVLTKKADVWVTFVSEGAGYRNALGYYTYKLGNQPNTIQEISAMTIILPNVSFNGSGGGLASGNKVHLGQFEANTVVAWFLVADGRNGSAVGNGRNVFYSDPEFNPETNISLRNHMVLLYDKSREQLLLSFEDIPRDNSNCDQDFNDAVFYASINPIDAVQKSNLKSIIAANDSDGDGINDELDDFPYDPNKAFNNFAPSLQDYGTLAYEDLWPSKGDYDFNDLVTDYQFNLIANSSNLITRMESKFIVSHIGAAFHNGLAFILPVPKSGIASVENQVMNAGYVNRSANGTESGVNETVIFVAENISILKGDTLNINVNFTNAVSRSTLGSAPFNAFLVVNGDRQREVHLPDLPPTSKGLVYLGNEDDYSNISYGRYFKTDRNLPWALNFYEPFNPPAERQSIDNAYTRFVSWANSGGTINLDWYK